MKIGQIVVLYDLSDTRLTVPAWRPSPSSNEYCGVVWEFYCFLFVMLVQSFVWSVKMKGDKTVPCGVPVFIVLVVEKCVGVEWFEVSLSCLLLSGDACDLDDDDDDDDDGDDDDGGDGDDNDGGDGYDDDDDAAAAADDHGSSAGCFLTQTVCVLLLRKSATQGLRWGQMFKSLSFCRRRCVCTVLNADEKSA